MLRRIVIFALALLICAMPFAPVASAATAVASVHTSGGGGVNLRTGPGSMIKGWVPEGSSVEIISTSGNWCRVKVLGNWAPKNGYSEKSNVGYIYRPYLTGGSNKGSSNLAGRLGETGNVARVRARTTLYRSKGSGSLANLGVGTRLVVLNTSGSWLRVTALRSNGSGTTGYVRKTAVTRGLAGAASTACQMRAGGSTRFGVVGSIPRGANVTILYVGASWSQVRYGSKTGYVYNNYLRLR